MPLAETQMATVLSNADPEGKGRVRVRMNWQTDGMQTGWVRVMTPDGGSSSDVKSNRGFVFIPEVGDQVLLGFRHGDPARPYVMGSLFNGTTGGGGLEGNHMKSLTTRSGHVIEFDDASLSSGITIKDRNHNVIHIDSSSNDIYIAACHDITISAKNDVTINAGGTMALNARDYQLNVNNNSHENIGQNKECYISNQFSIECTNKEEDINRSSMISVRESLTEIVGRKTIESVDGDVIIKASEKALLQGKDDARVSLG